MCRCIADTLAQRAHRACVLTRLLHMHECRFHSRTDPFAPCTAREGRAGARRACSILTCSISARAAAIRLLRLKSPPMTRAGSLLGGRCRYHRCQHSVLPAGLPASLIPPAIPAECTPVHAIGTPGPHPPGLLPVLSHPSNSQLRAWACDSNFKSNASTTTAPPILGPGKIPLRKASAGAGLIRLAQDHKLAS